jgi:hypothetical protein
MRDVIVDTCDRVASAIKRGKPNNFTVIALHGPSNLSYTSTLYLDKYRLVTIFYFRITAWIFIQLRRSLEFPAPCQIHHVFWINPRSYLAKPLHIPTIHVL